MRWRTIATAPKDGTPILVVSGAAISNEFEEARVQTVARWHKRGWHEYMLYPCRFKPTHWMPLPALPGVPK